MQKERITEPRDTTGRTFQQVDAVLRSVAGLTTDKKLTPDLETMRQFVPLDNLSRRSLRFVIDHLKIVKQSMGDILFDIGDTKPVTFYLIRGAIKLKDAQGKRLVVESGSDRSRYAIGNLLPRHYRAKVASKQAIVACIDRELLEKEIAWGQLSRSDKKGEKVDDNDWKLNLLRTPTFSRLPMANVQRLFENLEEFHCKTGDTIIQEGDPGDYYYIIREGHCKVVRQVGGREIRIGQLKETEAFGDEALVSEKPRNATVVMETNGTLMRLSKTHFQKLMHAPLVKRVNLDVVHKAVEEGKAMLIDVRMEEEFTQCRLPHAISIPLFVLYLKTQTLNRGLKYVVYCDSGSRSEAAAFLLTRRGFDAYVLDNVPRELAHVPAC